MMLADPAAPGVREVFGPVFGDGLLLPKSSDLRVLAQRVAALPAAQQPKGAADERPAGHGAVLHPAARTTPCINCLKPLGLAGYRRLQWNGVHEWNFWDRSLVYAIDYFLNNGYAAKKLNDWRAQRGGILTRGPVS